MRQELKDFLKSEDKVLILPRDMSRSVILQWRSCRSPLRSPLNFFLNQFAKASPHTAFTAFFYRTFCGMKIGKNVGFAQINIDLVLPEAIEIGDNSTIGWKTHITTHEFTQSHQRFGKVKIGKNVLVGGFSIIRSGVEIGDNSIVAMCSFVNCDIPANEIWGGVPARKISDVEQHHLISNMSAKAAVAAAK